MDITGDRWQSVHGRFSPLNDFWKRLDRVLSQADPNRDPDRSLAAFLAEKPGGHRFAHDRTLAREFVEGFHAAELDRVSERSIAEGGNPGGDSEEQRIGRIVEGYGCVVAALEKRVGRSVHLGCVVKRIDWSKRSVNVSASRQGGETLRIKAPAAIITIPVSLLNRRARGRGAIAFAPEIASVREAAASLAMGHVRKICLLLECPLDELLPEERGEKLYRLSFLHSINEKIPVWWTSYPLRSNLVTGWAGGSAALALESAGVDLRHVAIKSLAVALRIDPRTLASRVLKAITHDWTRDPFSRGAYSYTLVGGTDAAKTLSRPVQSTLFFAGEGADAEGRNGTVHGAIGSGLRASRQVLAALKERRN
jgi:monoamine oxidase